MKQLIELETWREIFGGALSDLGVRILEFLPNLIGAVLILILGWLLSRVVEGLSSRGLRRIGVDAASSRLRIAELLERTEIRLTLSQIIAKLLFWLVMLTFLVSSVETLGFTAVTATIDRLIAFIPKVIGAALIAVVGLLLSRLMGTLVRSGAAAAGFLSSGRLGFLAQMAVAGLVVVVACEQLGIATEVLILPLSVLLAGAGLAIGLAFALASRPVLGHILAGHFLKQSLPRNAVVEIGGRRGIVERVGAVDTLLRGEEVSFSVPNAQLMEEVVIR